MISSFFVPADRQAIVDVRPGWVSSEDLVGQYSNFSGRYLSTPALAKLELLHGTNSSQSPVVTMEEANLSAMEAYAGPLISTASATSWQELEWALHDIPEVNSPPTNLRLQPWPRFFGTVNIDSSAAAPAPKVTGRACVVLLEPPSFDDLAQSTDAITNTTFVSDAPGGLGFLADPRAAWAARLTEGNHLDLVDAIEPYVLVLAESAGRSANIVSPRDLHRCLLYMAWYTALAVAASESDLSISTDPASAAENALLHFVLPGLTSEQFRLALPAIRDSAIADGYLQNRLNRLTEGSDGFFGVPPDFWASLS
ncbi:hypothetical protein GCM10009617_03210 [Leifsonia poae]|uniref:Uncharacterized protein n=2 Tax=Leifsonia poae TaxID=110933 RepID=A0A9W6H7A6_9MICO|nr:hypothetical protein GCM10017584_03210 [Leifsonia poae]